MPVNVGYDDDQRLVISGLECDCPCEHSQPDQDIYVGTGLIPRLPKYIQKRGMGKSCVLVADKNTYEVAGREVERTLKDAGFQVVLCKIMREHDMDPDETACGEILLSIQPETEFLVAVGSGSITDSVRVNAVRTKMPFVCVGTAPSMDGYTSVVSPLLFRGVKVHRAGVCPEIIVCDIDILKSAPMPMVAAGVGDVLGKYIAKADWIIGNIINDEPYCPVCGEIVTDAVNKLVENVDEIRRKSEKGIRILIEALLLSGVTIMIVGHTRAVASVEHNIAHYWEMRMLAKTGRAPSHGASVGVATLMIWPAFMKFLGEDLSRLDIDKIKAGRISREDRVEWMLKAYGEAAGNAIMDENEGDFLSWEEQLRRIKRAQERSGDIKAAIRDMPSYEVIHGAMKELGALLLPSELDIDDELLDLSLRCAKDYRTRYTLFKTLDECGILDEYIDEIYKNM
ncbi:MAG: sn-glycerol-1-phosphate dehydrogenase [Christensenellales bacterium]|jgi:glycerol-1-phosphate dehydrogenase [NAD(P)+]